MDSPLVTLYIEKLLHLPVLCNIMNAPFVDSLYTLNTSTLFKFLEFIFLSNLLYMKYIHMEGQQLYFYSILFNKSFLCNQYASFVDNQRHIFKFQNHCHSFECKCHCDLRHHEKTWAFFLDMFSFKFYSNFSNWSW